jgi:tRNA(fMet)-specific endonuclease VapC
MTYNGYLFDTNIAIGMVDQEQDVLNFIQQAADDKMKISRIAGNLRENKRKKGRKVKTPDALIIATAVEQNLILVSKDHDMDFVENEFGVNLVKP